MTTFNAPRKAETAVSKPSTHKDTGYVGRRVSKRIGRAGVRIAYLTTVICDDLANGAADGNVQAMRAANEIASIGAHISYTEWARADGNMEEANLASLPLERPEQVEVMA